MTKYDSPPEKCVFFNKHRKIGLNNDSRIPPTSDPTERRERRLDLLKWHLKNDVVDAAEWLSVGDELVDLELAVHVVLDERAHLAAALDTAESTAFPYTAGDELECCSRY